jgi:ABC-type dipeptide/oligopeptide/nickel transport system ATPase component
MPTPSTMATSYLRKIDMRNNIKEENANANQDEQVRWVTDPVSLDKLRITAGHEKAANELVRVILEALKATDKVILAVGGESGTGKSEVAYLVGGILEKQKVATVAWSFDNAYLTTPEEREAKRAEDYDNNVGLNEMNRPKIKEIMSCFEQGHPVTVPIVVINEDGSRPIKDITLNMEGKRVLIFDGLYAALIGALNTGESQATRIIAMSAKQFNLEAQKDRGKEKINEHRMKVLERECRAVRALWSNVTHKITEDWEVTPYPPE